MFLDTDDKIRIGYAIGMKKERYSKVNLDIGEGLAGWVIENGKSLLSSKLPQGVKPTGRTKYVTSSFLLVPIFNSAESNFKPVGLICATDRLSKIPFSKEDKDLLTFIARQVGIALNNAILYEQATVDFLTKVYLRGYFFEKLDEILKKLNTCDEKASLLMLDIDHFKSVNDTYGHQVGDVILKDLGNILNKSIRDGDIAGRYGGEEFIILLKILSMDLLLK